MGDFNNNPNIPTQIIENQKLPQFCANLGIIPTGYRDSMTYYELVAWLCKFLEEKVIPTVNQNGQAVQELQSLYIQLKDYVNNYFDNLDITEEINQKIEDMMISGELATLILAAIKSNALIIFSNVEELKNATNIINGSVVQTLGYYTPGDGGASFYKIRNQADADVENLGSIFILKNDLVAELLTLEKRVNVKQFGAKGNGIDDDSESIIEAMNYFKVGSEDLNQNYSTVLLRNFPNCFAKVDFTPGSYKLSKTVNVPCYIDVDFFNSTIQITENNFTNNVVFSINSLNGTGWIYQYVSNIAYFKNLRIITQIEGLTAIYILDPHHIENINFMGFSRAIYYPVSYNGTRHYVDNIELSKLTLNSTDNTNYQIEKSCDGDGTLLSQIHTPSSQAMLKAINIKNSHSCILNQIINGQCLLERSNIEINGMHNEKGQLILSFCKGSVNDSEIYKRDANIIPIIIEDSNKPSSTNRDSLPIILKNTNIINYYTNDDFDYNSNYDISIVNSTEILELHNCYRESWANSVREKSLTGLLIQTSDKDILNIYDNCYIENKFLHSAEQVATKSNLSTDFTGHLTETKNLDWKIAPGTYYYKVIIFLDIPRLIGIGSLPEKNINLTNKGITINVNTRINQHTILRIYRGTQPNVYDQYIDIANPKNIHLFDNGLSVNGNAWKNNPTNELPTVITAHTLKYEYLPLQNELVIKAKMFNIVGLTNPNFHRGDTLELLNSSNGKNRYAYCISESGVPNWVYSQPVTNTPAT